MRFFNGKLKITKQRIAKAAWVLVSLLIVGMTLIATMFPGGVPVK